LPDKASGSIDGLRRRPWLIGWALVAAAVGTASAQIAVPYYGPEAFVAALQARAQAPQAQQFEDTARSLQASVEALCAARAGTSPAAGKAARTAEAAQAEADAEDPEEQPGSPLLQAQEAWLAAADAWERLQAISTGVTIERRSVRSLDFRPARPTLINRAIRAHGRGKQPPDAKALQRVGTPAKGLPALEWLLWDAAAPRTAAACRYATGLAQEVHREAAALAEAHSADADRTWAEEPEVAAARAAEAVNQWLAGLEGLRWRYLGKPLAVLSSKPAAPGPATASASGSAASGPDPHDDIWPRPPSASHREAWEARWQSLRNLAIGPAPTDGFGPQPAVAPAVVSLEAMLRGRGRNTDADAWAQAVMAADQAMQALTKAGAAPASSGQETALLPPVPALLPPVADMENAVAALDVVKRFMQETIAPALKVTLGFSDADGD
jgi:predicted lipoprotein